MKYNTPSTLMKIFSEELEKEKNEGSFSLDTVLYMLALRILVKDEFDLRWLKQLLKVNGHLKTKQDKMEWKEIEEDIKEIIKDK